MLDQMTKWNLAGVSGGPDSMAMLDMLRKQEIPLIVVHVNYKKRDSADRDMKIVENYCHQHGLLYKYKEVAEQPEGNFQAWARDLRYSFFKETAEEYGAGDVYIAHQLDDFLETWFMQKQKGIIPAVYGLAAENEVKGLRVHRPLLGYDKKQLEDYCKACNVPYGIDESNLSDHYRRNQIRHSRIEKMSLKEKKKLKEEIDAENEKLSAKREEAKAFLGCHEPIDLLDHQDSSFLLDLYLYKLTGKHYAGSFLREMTEQLKKDVMIDLQSHYLERYHNRLYVTKKEQPVYLHFKNMEELEKVMACQLGNSIYPFSLEKEGKKIESITLRHEDFPITIDPVRREDWIILPFGKKKVSRALMDRKIPKSLRIQWPVVRNCHNLVVFIPGIGCDVSHFSDNPNVFMVK